MKTLLVTAKALLMFCFFSSFFGSFFGGGPSPETIMAGKICKEIGKKLQHQYGLQFSGISEEGPEGKYKCIGLNFYIHRRLSKDEGRFLLLECARVALEAFNSHPEFKKHMTNVPFTNANVMIDIFVRDPKNKNFYHPDITVFAFFSDTIFYDTKNPYNSNHYSSNYYFEEIEPYEEAMRILEAQKRGEIPFSKYYSDDFGAKLEDDLKNR